MPETIIYHSVRNFHFDRKHTDCLNCVLRIGGQTKLGGNLNFKLTEWCGREVGLAKGKEGSLYSKPGSLSGLHRRRLRIQPDKVRPNELL